MAKYDYKQTEHATTRHSTHPGAVFKLKHAKHPHREGPLGINDAIGLGITKRVGTMWAAYAFFALSLVSLPAALSSGSAIVIVSWLAQTFLQLVLLPIIIVGQNIQANEAEKRAIATYDDATAILEEAKQIQVHLATQDDVLERLIDKLEKIEAGVKPAKASPAKKPVSKN